MAISPGIERALRIAFARDDWEAVRSALDGIPFEDAEWIQAATLALTFGNRALFDHLVVTAQADAHDIAYVLEAPGLVQTDLTRVELVRRYTLMGLPVPDRLVGD
jgi:hypothetical protein